ncbi:MAG TPA: hypothetical protein VK926_09175 [Gaiellaceae bacterium]|nr:hypothetical protein [Gaiellaceae bacterium]
MQTDAFDRALASETAVPTDASDRAQTAVVPTDAHERAPVDAATGPVVEETGWTVSWTDVVLAAAIGVGVVAAGVLLVSAIRRYPPRGHPPLAHR